uniref:Uncharacterized protein n=1 Tax=viral metagenome TaxID=1070528 RepID=A0A6M3LQU6_9ZZZZ
MKQLIVEKTIIDGNLFSSHVKNRTVYTDRTGQFIRNLHGKKYLFEENGKLTFSSHVKTIRAYSPQEVMQRLNAKV